MDRPIGSEFDIGNYRYRVEAAGERKCLDCDLYNICRDGIEGLNIADKYAGSCNADYRKDKKNVVFKGTLKWM